VVGVGLFQGRGQPAAGGPVQVREDAVEVPLILEPGCFGLEEQRDLGSYDRHAASGDDADLVQQPTDPMVTPEDPTVRPALLQEEPEHHGVGGELLLTDDGCRRSDAAKERQATELAGELLIPTKAAINAAFANKTNPQVADRFGVSIQFAQMRMAGARKIVERAIRKRTGNIASG
jgi:hypothetical protein